MHEVFVWCLKLYHTCFFQITLFSVIQSFFNLNANRFLNNIQCWLFSSNLMQLTAFPFSRNKINTSDIFNDGLLKNLNINLSFFPQLSWWLTIGEHHHFVSMWSGHLFMQFSGNFPSWSKEDVFYDGSGQNLNLNYFSQLSWRASFSLVMWSAWSLLYATK